MFEHILVPIDGSSLSALALPVAADLARRYGSSLTLLYVVPPPVVVYAESAYVYDGAEESARARAEGQRILEDARDSLDHPDVQLVRLDDADPRTAQAIADEVVRQGASLVVMSSHGRTGLEHFFLGSVAEGVMRRVDVPVLLVRQPKTSPTRTKHPAAQEAGR
ncbi:universal stress protein [Deinococcus aerophilus]|uniref:Universal stress protein n=2 Tax=Deinococcus aerophilus TaxID=522488 RepID=A0ABQ2GZR7_9DEIO|nr:universal stress protein [Deinococcus aerophilus]